MQEKKKSVLGVIGGLGPLAGAYFLELVTKMTNADIEQDHINTIMYSVPSIPDRTDFILNHKGEDPLPMLIKIAKKLEEQGVGQIAIPCMTAHYFYKDISSNTKVPVINAVKETVLYLKNNGINSAGVMATDGTLHTGLFEMEMYKQGIRPIIPSLKKQKEVMHLIYDNIKLGKQIEMEKFYDVKNELFESGAQVIILGCTELSLIKRNCNIGSGFVDALEILAQQSILRCGGQIQNEYISLITQNGSW